LGNEIASIGVVIMFALSPGYILGLQGILSEALYLLLSMMFLLYFRQERLMSNWRVLSLGLLLAAVMLTRTIGYALLIAICIQKSLEYLSSKKLPRKTIQIVIVSLVGIVVFMWFLGPERESHYVSVLHSQIAGQESGFNTNVFVARLFSILDAWQTSWIIYWISELSATYIAILCLLLAAISELGIRLTKNKVDAWYIFSYLLILMIWPHPGQMMRLLLPISPVLLIYAFNLGLKGSLYIPHRSASRRSMALLYGVLVVSVLPAHAFIHGRLTLAERAGLVPVYEIFRKPDIVSAQRDLYVQNQMFEDFSRIGQQVNDNEQVLYYQPTYLAVLGDQLAGSIGYPVDSGVRNESVPTGSRSILLTALHPRKTRKGIDGFGGEENLVGWTSKQWCSYNDLSGEVVSCLYQVVDQS